MRVIQWNIVLSVLSLLITACGGGGNADENEAKAINNPPQLLLDAVSFTVSENTYDITFLAAFDIDDEDELQLSLSGQDASHIVFDDNTGKLAFIQPPNFDNPQDKNGDNIYEVTIRLSDKGGLVDEQSITIHVRDNPGPEFHPPSVIQTPEHSSVVHRFSIGDDPSISITVGGIDAQYFNYQDETGLLYFFVAPDYESPFDDNGDNIYHITLQAHSINGQSAIREVDIEVNDIDESQNQAPIIIVSSEMSLDENRLGVLSAPIIVTDLEQDEFTLLLEGEDASFFFIDDEGQLANSEALDYESPKDADSNNRYELVIRAIDSHGLQSSEAFSVVLLDLDDSSPENQPPVLTMDGAVSFVENSHEHVLGFNVSDPEGDDIRVYFSGPDADLFSLGHSGRSIFFKASPDFELPVDTDKDNVYHFTVNADDGELASSQQVEVRVTDVRDELRLSIDSVYYSEEVSGFIYLRVPENTLEIGMLKVEGLPGGNAEFILAGPNSHKLEIDADTFVLRYTRSQDLEADPGQIYADIVAYTGDLRSSLLRLIVVPTNVKEPPFFDIGNDVIETPENILDVVSFTVKPDKSNAEIVEITAGGDDAGLFSVSSSENSDGSQAVQVSFIEEPDFESPRDLDLDGTYLLSIGVKDSDGLKARKDFSIAVTDVTEPNHRPKLWIAKTIYVNPYVKDIPLIASAVDKDQDEISYSLEGEHAHYLQIDESTGDIDFADDFSRESLPLSIYTGFGFTVKASDSLEESKVEVDLKFYAGELDILFPGRENVLTEKGPSYTSLVVEDLSRIAESVDVDGTPLAQSSNNLFTLDRVDYDLVGNFNNLNITDSTSEERNDFIVFGAESVIYSIGGMEHIDGNVVISDRFSNRLYAVSNDPIAQRWRALSCSYSGDGHISKFTEGDEENSFYVVVKDGNVDSRIFNVNANAEVNDSDEGCYSEILTNHEFKNIQDLLYDNTRGVLYIYDADEQGIYRLDPASGEVTSLFKLSEGGSRQAYLAQSHGTLYFADASSSKLYSIDLEKNTHIETLLTQDKTLVSGLAVDSSAGIAYVFYTATQAYVDLSDAYEFQVIRKLDLSTRRFIDDESEAFTRVNAQSRIDNPILIAGSNPRIMAIEKSTNNLVDIPLNGDDYKNTVQGSFFIDFNMHHLALDEQTNSIYLSLSPTLGNLNNVLDYIPGIKTTSKIVKYLPGQGVGYTVFQDFSFDINALAFDSEKSSLALVNGIDAVLYHDPRKYNSAKPEAELGERFIFAIYQGSNGASYLLVNDYDLGTVKLVKIEDGEELTLASLGFIGIFSPYENFVVDDSENYAYVLNTSGGGTKIEKIDLKTGEAEPIYENVDLFSSRVRWGLSQDTLILLSHDDKRRSSLISIGLADASATSIMSHEVGEGPVVSFAKDFVVHRKAEVAYVMSRHHLHAVDLRTGNRAVLNDVSPANSLPLQ